jgi:hypothetical protein
MSLSECRPSASRAFAAANGQRGYHRISSDIAKKGMAVAGADRRDLMSSAEFFSPCFLRTALRTASGLRSLHEIEHDSDRRLTLYSGIIN